MTDNDLHRQLVDVQTELQYLEKWIRLGRSDQGSFLLEELKRTREVIRNSYRKILMDEHSKESLSGVQREEHLVDIFIAKLENAESEMKRLDAEAGKIVALLKVRNESVPNPTIVSRYVHRKEE